MAAERIRKFLAGHGVEFEAEAHPREVSAQRVASVEHVSGWNLAKPVMLMAGDELVMAVVPAPAYVDLERASEVLAAEVRLATEAEFTGEFPDCEAGAEPPFGSLYGIPTYVDPTLDEDEFIVFRAGTHDMTMRMAMTDYLAVEDPKIVDLARHPATAG